MNKEFVPYQEALGLKELGFDALCFATWSGETLDQYLQIPSDDYFTKAPTFSQAFRWFREKYNYNHSIVFTKHPFGTDEYQYMILLEDNEYVEINFKTYEEAELACLRKLIEIAKQNG